VRTALLDVGTKKVIGKKSFDAAAPPGETTRTTLDDYEARQAARAAAYLKTLPVR
jgi:hypothetical protein